MAYLLDTGLLIHAIRNSNAFNKISTDLGLTTGGFNPVISIISQGELLGVSRKFDWGEKKLKKLGELLERVVIIPVDRESIAITYSELEHLNIKQGINLGQNDLWIAATAIVYRLTVLTFDGDFERSPSAVAYIRYDQDSGDELKRHISKKSK